MDNDNERSSKRGFTLIEILIALTIMGLATVTILGLESSILSSTVRSEQRITALSLARLVLTQLEYDPPQESIKTAGDIKQILEQLGSSPLPINLNFPEFQVSVSVNQITQSVIPPNTLMLASVTVSWSEYATDSVNIPFYYIHPDKIQ